MLSAVIITKDAADHIVGCIDSCKDVVKEIILVDAESTDDTILKATGASDKVQVFTKSWTGYGAARNYGAEQASSKWILSIDADETIAEDLHRSLENLQPTDEQSVYAFKRINVYRGKQMRYGMLGPEIKQRVYHRSHHQWDDALVHEGLERRDGTQSVSQVLRGHLLHQTYDDPMTHREKLKQYARLSAQQWKKTGRHPSWLEKTFSPSYHFIKNYFLRGGIFDTAHGWETSVSARQYHAEKYRQYRSLDQLT